MALRQCAIYGKGGNGKYDLTLDDLKELQEMGY